MTIGIFSDDVDPKAAALAAARLAGCTCQPEVTITRIGDGVSTANVAHDSWCALLRAKDRN